MLNTVFQVTGWRDCCYVVCLLCKGGTSEKRLRQQKRQSNKHRHPDDCLKTYLPCSVMGRIIAGHMIRVVGTWRKVTRLRTDAFVVILHVGRDHPGGNVSFRQVWKIPCIFKDLSIPLRKFVLSFIGIKLYTISSFHLRNVKN